MQLRFIIPVLLCAAAVPGFSQPASWAGPYVGANLGYGFGKSKADVQLGGAWASESQALRDLMNHGLADDLSPKGFGIGVRTGYNFQTPKNFVFGGEVEVSAQDVKDDKKRRDVFQPTPSLAYNLTSSIDVKQSLALLGRFGIARGSNLIYASGGWSWARADLVTEILSTGNYSKEARTTKTLNGPTLGVGVEHKYSERFSVRAEYRYTDYGKARFSTDYRPGSSFTSPAYTESLKRDLSLSEFRVGATYHF